MQVGQKKAREMWFLAKFYSAQEADKMGLVNKVVPVSIYCFPKLSTRLRIFLVLSAATLSSLHLTSVPIKPVHADLHFPDVDTQYMGLCQM